MNIEDKIKNYFVQQDDIIAAYLFGSYAASKARPFSDIDIGILFDGHNAELMLERRNQIMVELGRILRKDIHPVVMNSAGEVLLKQIFSKGKCLLIRNHRKHAEFKMVQYSRIADFEYYKKQFQTAFVKKVVEGDTIG